MNPPEILAALDTSVVMRLLTGHPPDLATCARSFLADVENRQAKVYVSNLVVLEAYFACQHHYRLPKGAVLSGLHVLFRLPTFVVHPRLLGLLKTKALDTIKPGFLDRLIHAESIEAGLPLVTFEKAASRLPNTQVLQ